MGYDINDFMPQSSYNINDFMPIHDPDNPPRSKKKRRRKKRRYFGMTAAGEKRREEALPGWYGPQAVGKQVNLEAKPQGGLAGFLQQGGQLNYKQNIRHMDVEPPVGFGPGTQNPLREHAGGRRSGGGGSGGIDPQQAFLNSLMEYVQGSQVDFDYEGALKDTVKGIRKAYAADINAIRSGNKQARRQTRAGREELDKMYNALSQSYEDMGAKQMKQATRLSNQIQRRSERSAAGITNEAQGMLDENAALAKGLGIEQGFTETTKPILEESLGEAARVRSTGTGVSNRQLLYGRNNQNFMQKGSVNSQLEGTNREADLVADLQNYLQDGRREIGQLKGQRAREIGSTKASLAAQAAEMEASAAESHWEKLMDIGNLGMDIEKETNLTDYRNASLKAKIAKDRADARARLQSGAADPSNPFGDAVPDYMANIANILAGPRGRNPRVKQNMKFMNQLIMGDNFTMDKAKTNNKGEVIPLTPFKAAEIAAREARKAGVPEKDIPLIKMAAMAAAEAL